MLAYLEQGSALYVLAAFCLIGVIGKLVVNRIYKSLNKQAENLATATDKQLLQFKTKYESLYRMNNGIKDCEAFVQKVMQQYRVLGFRLRTWDNCDLHIGGLGLVLCTIASFSIYWMQGNPQISILYLAVSAITAVGLMLFHSVANSEEQRRMLEVALTNYFSNVLVVRGARAAAAEIEQEEIIQAKSGIKDDIFIKKTNKAEAVQNEEPFAGEEKGLLRAKGTQRAEMEALKESLSQIAAARSEGGDKRNRKLSQKEEQLIDEILRQYLS